MIWRNKKLAEFFMLMDKNDWGKAAEKVCFHPQSRDVSSTRSCLYVANFCLKRYTPSTFLACFLQMYRKVFDNSRGLGIKQVRKLRWDRASGLVVLNEIVFMSGDYLFLYVVS